MPKKAAAQAEPLLTQPIAKELSAEILRIAREIAGDYFASVGKPMGEYPLQQAILAEVGATPSPLSKEALEFWRWIPAYEKREVIAIRQRLLPDGLWAVTRRRKAKAKPKAIPVAKRVSARAKSRIPVAKKAKR